MHSALREYIERKKLTFTDQKAPAAINRGGIPASGTKVVVALTGTTPDDYNTYYRATIEVTKISNYSNYTIKLDEFNISYNTELGNTTAYFYVKDAANVSKYEGRYLNVYWYTYDSRSFLEYIIPRTAVTMNLVTGHTYKAGPIPFCNVWYDFDYAANNDSINFLQFANSTVSISAKLQKSVVDDTKTYRLTSGFELITQDDITFSLHMYSPVEDTYVSLEAEPNPCYPNGIPTEEDLGDEYELVKAYDLATGALTLSGSGDYNWYYTDTAGIDSTSEGYGRAKEGCQAYLVVNERVLSGECVSVTPSGISQKAQFKFGTAYTPSISEMTVTYRSSVNSPKYQEAYPKDADPYGGSSAQVSGGRALTLYYVVKKETPGPSPEEPYKAIIPEQTIKFSSDDAGWPTDKRYEDELRDALDAGEDVHVELTFLDDGAPYSEPIDVFAPVELRKRGENIQITIMSDVWFSLYLFGDSNGAVRTADNTYSYQGRIKFHVYTGTKPEPEPAPKPDPMMSSKWNKNFTAQYNDNSTAGEIKDFLRKEKKKITGHNIHELLDDFEEGGDGGDDSGSSCKCISLVEEITQNQQMETVHTLKGATAKEVLDAVYAGVPVVIALNLQTFGGQGMEPGFLGSIYLDSSNNTYYANVYGGLGASVTNQQNVYVYGFSNMLTFTGTADSELSFTAGGGIT